MKHVLAAAAAVLAAAALAPRPSGRDARPARPAAIVPAPAPVPALPVPVAAEIPGPAVPIEIAEQAVQPLGPRTEAVAPRRRTEEGSTQGFENLLFFFERELDLSPEQRVHMEGALAEREEEILAYHRSIRASGVFRVREYQRRIREIKADYYGRMGRCLTASQSRRFAELLAGYRLGDSVAITIDGLAVVE